MLMQENNNPSLSNTHLTITVVPAIRLRKENHRQLHCHRHQLSRFRFEADVARFHLLLSEVDAQGERNFYCFFFHLPGVRLRPYKFFGLISGCTGDCWWFGICSLLLSGSKRLFHRLLRQLQFRSLWRLMQVDFDFSRTQFFWSPATSTMNYFDFYLLLAMLTKAERKQMTSQSTGHVLKLFIRL